MIIFSTLLYQEEEHLNELVCPDEKKNLTNSEKMKAYTNANGVLKGFDGLDSEDFTIPRVRLCQNTSRTGVPGKFFSVLSSEVLDDLVITVLSVRKQRSMWPEGSYQAQEPPVCKSRDGKVKFEGIGDGVCKSCTYSKWQGKIPPKCNEVFEFFCIDDDGSAFIILFKSTAVKYVKKYISSLRNRHMPPFSVQTKISARREENNKGVFFVPQFDIIKEYEVAEMDYFCSMLDQYAPYLPKDSLDKEEQESLNTVDYGTTTTYAGVDDILVK